MSHRLKTTLRIEKSENISGKLLRASGIPVLKENDYYVEDNSLDGDAPKQFIKAYFFEPDSGVKKRNLDTWRPFIAKSAEKWYPHESVVEYLINLIGIELGLNMNRVRLVVANGQIRFLSEYFLQRNEVLVHGAEICGEYLEDHEMAKEIAVNFKTSRELFTFQFICEAIKSVFPDCCENLICDLVKVITYDAIVGNNDRHFYNWGVIRPVRKTLKMPKFAPIYDSARGLLWNQSEQSVVDFYSPKEENKKRILKYIQGAIPRISIDKNSDVNHFELVSFVKGHDARYCDIINELITEDKEKRVLRMLENGIFEHFSPERRGAITHILKERFSILRGL